MSRIQRRNLNSGQWACIAVEAEELIAAIQADVETKRREKQADTQAESKGAMGQKIVPQTSGPVENKTAHKAAELFNTNTAIKMQKVWESSRLTTQQQKVLQRQVSAGGLSQVGQRVTSRRRFHQVDGYGGQLSS